MKTIFCDMDGVLCDFEAGYKAITGRTPADVRTDSDRKLYSMYWDTFLDAEGFARLPWHRAGGIVLADRLKRLDSKHFNVCVLSSSGGFHRQREVAKQKMQWLADHDIYFPVVIVPGRKYKAGFARPNSLLIDDTLDVITDFEYAGGQAIHHNNWFDTSEKLDRFIDDEWLP
jgi:FMN phosphatase YigB (HAD superfamily)